MSRGRRLVLVALGVLVSASFAVAQIAPPTSAPPPSAPGASTPTPGPPPPNPGEPAPPDVVAELQRALAQAVARFERRDLEGVLGSVSDRYRSGPLTKPLLRQELAAMFAAHDALTARVRIDEVRMIGDRAWVYSTGEVAGRLRLIGTTMPLVSWQDAPEVAWRENGRWRLIGDQQR